MGMNYADNETATQSLDIDVGKYNLVVHILWLILDMLS